MDMTLNSIFIKNIRDYGINADIIGTAIFIMISLDKERYDLLDALDDNNKERRMMMLYHTLNRKGLIQPSKADAKAMYEITLLGYDFLNYVYSEIGNEIVNSEEEVKQTIKEEIKNGDVEDWIIEYVTIFPRGIIEGKRLRTSSAECIEKMKKFQDKYPKYKKDTILAATKLYLKEENGGQQYTRNSTHFIYKNDKEKGYISDLLAYCERIEDMRDNPQTIQNMNKDVI